MEFSFFEVADEARHRCIGEGVNDSSVRVFEELESSFEELVFSGEVVDVLLGEVEGCSDVFDEFKGGFHG